MPVQMPNATSPYTAAEPAGTDNHTSDTSQTEGTSGSGSVIDAGFGDGSDKKVTMEDFLTLMVAQLKNQDFMNPVDDTQYVTQLAQFTTMQQMEEMAYNSKSTYITSMVGKYVVASKMTVSGELDTSKGIVNKISLVDNEYLVFVNDKPYKMSEIMEVQTPPENNSNSGNNDGNSSGNNDGDDKKNNSGK